MKITRRPIYQAKFDGRLVVLPGGKDTPKSDLFSIKRRTRPEKLLLVVTLLGCVAAMGWANRPRPVEQLGLNQLRQGSYALAAETLTHSLDVHGKSVESYLGLSSAANQQGQYLEGLKYADQALSYFQGEPAAWAERARANLGMQNYREAISDAQQSLSIQPHNHLATAIKHRALLLLAQQKATTFTQ